MLHGEKPLHILAPNEAKGPIGIVNTGQVFALFGGGTGFGLLQSILHLAATAPQANSCYLLPLSPDAVNPEYANAPGATSHYTALLIANYTTFPFSARAVSDALSQRVARHDTVRLAEDRAAHQASTPHWKIEKKLTVKAHGKRVFLYGNADIFANMALSAGRFAAFGDDAAHNARYAHAHFDSYENTARSTGVMMEYFWQDG